MFFPESTATHDSTGNLYPLRFSGAFSLELTLESGQFFQWGRSGDGFVVQSGPNVFYIEQRNHTLWYRGISGVIDPQWLRRFFRLDDNLAEIFREWAYEGVLQRTYERFAGLRILRQDPWECTLAFLCSMASNIPRITGNLQTLARRYGTTVASGGTGRYALLPGPDQLRAASLEDLYDAGLGFRARYIHGLVPKMGGEIDFISLAELPYEETGRLLTSVHGIGAKVADCIQLFALGNLEAFPIDTWIRKVLHTHYFSPEIRSTKRLAPMARDYFGSRAGYAQQYLFHGSRSGFIAVKEGTSSGVPGRG